MINKISKKATKYIGKKKKRKLLTDMHTMVGNYAIGLLHS